jgi:hypothetical protein
MPTELPPLLLIIKRHTFTRRGRGESRNVIVSCARTTDYLHIKNYIQRNTKSRVIVIKLLSSVQWTAECRLSSRVSNDYMWIKHTFALAGFRHVANKNCGEIGCSVKYLTSPNPMPRLEPVTRIDFIPNWYIYYWSFSAMLAFAPSQRLVLIVRKFHVNVSVRSWFL